MTIDYAKATTACEQVAALVQRSLETEQRTQIYDSGVLRVPLIAYALATLRQRVAPAFSPCWSADPPHTAMFGGTNSGKSTILNLLLGQPAAGMNFLARYTQHPAAFSSDSLGDGFLVHHPSRFCNYQRYNNVHPPRQNDQELRKGYKPALSVHNLSDTIGLTTPVATRGIFWDVPDYSTEEASYYMTAVLDAIATADLVLIVVTNESYAGHRDMLLRGLIAASGVPVRVVANKLQDGSALLADIQRKLSDYDDHAKVTTDRIHPLPLISGSDDMTERLRRLLATAEAAELRRLVGADIAEGAMLKKQALVGTVQFLDRRLDDVLAPLQAEVEIANQWVNAVNRATEQHIYAPYKKNYLDGHEYTDFNLAFLRFLDLLEIPGIGTVISGIAKSIRGVSDFVLRGIRSWFGGQQTKKASPEHTVLETGSQRWIEDLKAFAQEQASQTGHPEWRRLAQKMDQVSFLDEMAIKLGDAWQTHRKNMDNLIQQRAQMLETYVKDHPVLHRSLQGIKLTFDTVAVTLAISTGGLDPTDFLLGPAVVGLLRIVIEIVGEQFVEGQKRILKTEQEVAMRNVIDQYMVKPTRQLFQAPVSEAELQKVRADFALVKQAALAIGTT